MPFYVRAGDIPAKRHTAFFGPDGERRIEELMGQEGFSSRSSLLYHRVAPTTITSIEPVAPSPDLGLSDDHPVTPRHLRTAELPGGSDLVTERHVLLANADVSIAWATASEPSSLYRNAIGDEVVYVHEGSATLESVFGRLAVSDGDYVVIPGATTHRWVPDGAFAALVIESRGHIGPPRRYLSSSGQFLEHAPYCERDIRVPVGPFLSEGDNVPVLVRSRAGLSRHTYLHHPFDVVGWDGHLFPYAFNIADFEPIVGSIHQPPPVHQTFEGPGMVICSFVPRPFDFHPDAVKVPYHHANTDSDEVLFYADGNFMSRARSGIARGSISYHPMGHIHGPQPGSYEASREVERTNETAVMIDAFQPLMVSERARAVSDQGYLQTWLPPDGL